MVEQTEIDRLRPMNGGLRSFIIVALNDIIRRRTSLWRYLGLAVIAAALVSLYACQDEPPPKPAVKTRITVLVKAEDWPKGAELPEEWQGLFHPAPGHDPLFTLQPPPGLSAAETASGSSSQETLFTIQVGSFRGQNPAQAELERLRTKGLDVFIQTNAINSVTWFRICHGYFRDESQAKDTARQLVRSGLTKAYRIVRVRQDEPPA